LFQPAIQSGEGRKIGIPYGSNPDTCPVRMLQLWLEAEALAEGPAFRSVDRHSHLLTTRLLPPMLLASSRSWRSEPGLTRRNTPVIPCELAMQQVPPSLALLSAAS